ncbi:MAG: hypothetical protein ACP6IY_09395 [Promethearchaeia archaeon]
MEQENQEDTNLVKSESEFNLNDLKVKESSSFDASLYEGQRLKIEKIEMIEVIDKFPIDANTGKGIYDANSTLTKKVVEITTEPLKKAIKTSEGVINFTSEDVEFNDKEGNVKKIQISHRFNLQKGEDGWFISKHPKASLWAFMRKIGVQDVLELKDKYVTLTTTPSKDPEDDKIYLNIVTK